MKLSQFKFKLPEEQIAQYPCAYERDAEGNIVATAEFNATNTGGSIVDAAGNLIAVYSSSLFANDYTVTIYDNNICSDMAILMIIASYISDYKADSRSSSRSKK